MRVRGEEEEAEVREGIVEIVATEVEDEAIEVVEVTAEEEVTEATGGEVEETDLQVGVATGMTSKGMRLTTMTTIPENDLI